MANTRALTLDKIGITLSIACAIHCLLLPVLLVVVSVGAVSWLVDEQTELIILGVAGVIAGLSLWRGCRVHRRLSIWLIFAAAAALIIAGHSIASHSDMAHSHDLPFAYTLVHIAGGICLAGAQLINLWLCKKCPACELDREQVHAHSHSA